jgi:hypothetical protein
MHPSQIMQQRLVEESPMFSYPGWREDRARAEGMYCEYPSSSRWRVQSKLMGMRNKQRLFEGDRSHPDIVALDSGTFTYPGWQEDRDEAEAIHTDSLDWSCETFEEKLKVMKKKQRMHTNRSRVRFLKDLDSCTFTYPGWRDDKVQAETFYCESASSKRAQEKLTGMQNKQRLFDGDRSHPQIVALDSTTLTYRHWKKDKEEAEKIHTASTWLSCETFDEKLHVMKRKQQVHSNRSSINFIRELNSLEFTYPGWGTDKVQAITMYCESSNSRRARQKLMGMKNKQSLFEGDRSHPEIISLDSQVFTYQGWQEDKKEAERIHTVSLLLSCETFEEKLCAMKRKQRMYSNRASINFLRPVESPSSSRPAIRQPKTPCLKKKATVLVHTASPKPARTEEVHCVVCWEREPSHAYIPCGHRCVCAGCASRARTISSQSGSLQCPVCRSNALCVTKIYL